MEGVEARGILSLLPVVLALFLAFRTKDAVFSLVIGCLLGVILAGFDPATGLSKLFQNALGNADFIWVMMIEVAVGIMVAFYLRAGVIGAFAEWAGTKIRTRRAASGFGWLLGIFVFFSDYFSPLFSGPIARPLTDKYKVSREMLAYTLDSGSAPVCTLIPLTGWAVYIAGLLKGYGPIETAAEGMSVFVKAIPYNFYGWFAVILAGLIAYGIIPNYGPMRKAELRAKNEGKVIRDGATPLTGEEMDLIKPIPDKKVNLFVFLVVPVLIVIGIALGTFMILGSTKILEAFFAAVMFQAVAMSFGGYFKGVKDGMDVAVNGIKAVLPAILILALAYCINTISKSLGAQQFIISLTQSWMTAGMLPVITFITGALISFFTGTSWGTYAILTPFVLPVAMNLSGGEINSVVLATVGAVVGGGLFGDHCSPVSDTTCLSSFGAASDHMDHVATQLPYALTAAALSAALFIVIGFIG
ncbi:MAG: Na+/H+ antiporter NhaC family protein [Thermovirgaceae bacterium]|jgi:Na+/H+ antiporter NhaC|nr:Na+/H+ antiporter NhaC family protein [Synergistales bacterium]MDI9393556.1 Na+/H+ antiporter NhaC family protein [Synergistota bacterium]HRW87046.1 Na+/H+ antiporter NhaC family protein [Thermovirgaceae bacterium]MDD3830919.1 Na+/H+ antiporter NhaC family protein [Synergistales bacterium]MDD5515456.1 Na+/H+ antiporter NhaC family protein [Synergistales bacterium]